MEALKTKKGDFVEIEFIGRDLSDENKIFDTNIASEAKKINPKAEAKPLIACIGKSMVVKGLDKDLENKEINKTYKIKLSPEEAFGKRNSQLVRLIPMKVFLEQKVYPQPGMTLALDNSLVKVISVSGGRVLVDFNNPLSGKDVEFEFKIIKIIQDKTEKVKATQNFLFGQNFDFELDSTGKKIIFKDPKLMQLLNVFRPKFQELLDMDVEIFAKKEEKAGKKDPNNVEVKKA